MTDTLAKPSVFVETPAQLQIDALARLMMEVGPQEMEVEHVFTPGLYERVFYAPANTIIISKIHRTRHPYVLLRGEVSVWIEAEGWQRLKAPLRGITEPGTRRLLYTHTDIEWLTFHATEETDLAKIEEHVIEPREVSGGNIDEVQSIIAQITEEVL